MSSLTSDGLTPQLYLACMRGFAQAYAHVDKVIEDAETNDLPVVSESYTNRSQWLNSYLPAELPDLALQIRLSGAEYYGARYVVEGSTMGAKLILKRLSQPGLDLDLTFWENQVSMSRGWARYCEDLNLALITEAQRQRALKGACSVYELLLSTFNPESYLNNA